MHSIATLADNGAIGKDALQLFAAIARVGQVVRQYAQPNVLSYKRIGCFNASREEYGSECYRLESRSTRNL